MIPVGHHLRCCCFDEIGHRKIELEEIFYVCRQMHDPPCKCLLQSHLVLLTAGFWTIYSLGEPFMGHGNWERGPGWPPGLPEFLRFSKVVVCTYVQATQGHLVLTPPEFFTFC